MKIIILLYRPRMQLQLYFINGFSHNFYPIISQQTEYISPTQHIMNLHLWYQMNEEVDQFESHTGKTSLPKISWFQMRKMFKESSSNIPLIPMQSIIIFLKQKTKNRKTCPFIVSQLSGVHNLFVYFCICKSFILMSKLIWLLNQISDQVFYYLIGIQVINISKS